jgi:hypothetical protein
MSYVFDSCHRYTREELKESFEDHRKKILLAISSNIKKLIRIAHLHFSKTPSPFNEPVIYCR